MNPKHEQRLEAEVDRLLKGLPELEAPPSLAARVLATLQSRARAPWYRQTWQNWPLGLRLASLVTLLVLFGGLSFECWKLTQLEGVAGLRQAFSGWLSVLGTVFNAFQTLVVALVVVVKRLGTPVLIAGLAAVGLAWTLCVGLGTACVRLAFAKR